MCIIIVIIILACQISDEDRPTGLDQVAVPRDGEDGATAQGAGDDVSKMGGAAADKGGLDELDEEGESKGEEADGFGGYGGRDEMEEGEREESVGEEVKEEIGMGGEAEEKGGEEWG